ncbi:uncharacterized protein si:cabz01007807.1 isoform X2 [Trichomycterus rosablanca]|uniref:uncharacterized protein si:cabz01007807.1 isoform X2 n=1 Tax=Trichomycterus rosablanca TaxID=2290929 RepID=UPI002F3536F0
MASLLYGVPHLSCDAQDQNAGGQNNITSGEPRLSITDIQEVLRRVSLSPLPRQYESDFITDCFSGTDSSGSRIHQNGYQNKVNPFQHSAQNGFTSKSSNPFVSSLMKVDRISSSAMNPFTQGNDSSVGSGSENNNLTSANLGQSNGWAHFPTSSSPTLENWVISTLPVFNGETKPTTSTTRTAPETEKTNQLFPRKEESSEKTEQQSSDNYLLEYILASQQRDCQPTHSTTASNWQDAPSFLHSPDTLLSPTPQSNGTPLSQSQCQIKPFSYLTVGSLMNNGHSKPHVNNFAKQVPPTELSRDFQKSSTVVPPQNASLNGVVLIKPPKPVPRRRVPKNPSQTPPQTQFTPLQSPTTPTCASPNSAIQAKANTQETVPAENSQVYEDILFIGQERCVEDWPEDSPEFSPDWKPTGKLKLRRDSWKIPVDSDDTLGEKYGKTKQKRAFIITSPSSKKTPDSITGAYSALPKMHNAASEDNLSDRDEPNAKMNKNSLKKKKPKLIVPHLSYRGHKDDLLAEPCEHKMSNDDGIKDCKQKEPLKFKVTLPRRHSRVLSEDNLKKMNGNQSMVESRDNLLEEPCQQKLRNGEAKGMKDCKPKEHLKFKVVLPRRHSKGGFEDDLKKTNGSLFLPPKPLEQSKDNDLDEPCKRNMKNGEAKKKDCKPKEPLKFKVSLPHQHSQDAFENDTKKMNGGQPLEESKNVLLEGPCTQKTGNGDSKGIKDCKPEPLKFTVTLPRRHSKVDLHDEPCKQKNSNGKSKRIKDCKPKEPLKFTVTLPRRHSKGAVEDDLMKMNGGQPFEESKVATPSHKSSKGLKDAGVPSRGAGLFKAGDNGDDDSWTEMDPKPQKLKKSQKPKRKSKAKDQSCFPEDFDPRGATSCNFYLSEAAKAEWMSSQMDVRRVSALDEEGGLDGVQEEDEGDTDSLMEWWNTVELWDEVPSDEKFSNKEDETKSFTEIADKVHRGLRVFYKSFTEQAEVLYQDVLLLYAIGDDVSNFHRRTKIANITGGTTTAVGGVATIAGLALAPFTLGTSLIVSAVGLGVATAGGIAAASATISDNVHEMNDRKKIEVVLQDFETRLADFRRGLSFVAEGVQRLRYHPLLHRNNYYAGDWEVRRALQTIGLAGEPVEHAVEVMDNATVAINSMWSDMDKYFNKDSKEVKKGCKKEVMMQVHLLAKLLQDSLVELNSIREQLMEAIGQV